MFYKIILALILTVYILSSYFHEILLGEDRIYPKNIPEEIYVDEDEINVFDKKPVDKITIKDKKVKAWIITVKYDETNLNKIKTLLSNSGYQMKNNRSKMSISIGPFASLSQAKEESNKISKILGLDNKILSFVF